MQHCENCNHDATLLDGVSQIAFVDYYRCPMCGAVWTTPKEGDDQSNPTDQGTTDNETSVP